MSIGATLRTLVLSDSAITDVIGAGANARLYLIVLPPEVTTPAMTYREISGAGNSEDPASYSLHTSYRIQFDIYDTNAVQLKALRDSMFTLLHHYSGTVGGQKIVDVNIDLMFDIYYPEPAIYRQVMDIKIVVEGS